MGFTLDKVVPWGRSFEEYCAMFNLSESDLAGQLLGCGDGPASFNASLTRQGGSMVSVDPIYTFSAHEIQERIDETYETVIGQARRNMEDFIWDRIASPEALGRIRMQAMTEFLADYPAGLEEGRYVAGALPELPFPDRQFDLAVCSHFLFLYSEQLTEDFHVESIRELCRVAREVRIFPTLEFGAQESRHLQAVTDRLLNGNHSVSVEIVPYEFQKNGNRMMSVRRTDAR